MWTAGWFSPAQSAAVLFDDIICIDNNIVLTEFIAEIWQRFGEIGGQETPQVVR